MRGWCLVVRGYGGEGLSEGLVPCGEGLWGLGAHHDSPAIQYVCLVLHLASCPAASTGTLRSG